MQTQSHKLDSETIVQIVYTAERKICQDTKASCGMDQGFAKIKDRNSFLKQQTTTES